MKKVVAIVGPTAVGKTEISIAVAKRYQSEIISGDSTQLYKDLNIGTAKIKEDEKQGIIHHFIDVVEADGTYDVKTYQSEVRKAIESIEKPLIVGGTGLYIKSVLDDYDFSGKGRDFDFEKQYEKLSNEALYELLQEKSYEASLKTHANNRRRVLRALALADEKTSIKVKKDKPIYNYKIIYLTLPRKVLYERINLRADLMLKEGMLDEVKALRKRNILPNVINYKQLNTYLDGKVSLEEAIETLKKDTRRYAKRQDTWFKNQMDTVQIDISDKDQALKEIFKILDEFWG